MAKKKTAKKTSEKVLPKLTPAPQQVLTYLVNNLLVGDYARCCSLEDMAKNLGKKEGALKRIVEQLVVQGYLETEGKRLDRAYPTVAAIRQQDSSLSVGQAKQLLKKARR